ncbi:MAG: hypothetical protein IPM57_05830 [Oligoflexia bacterium]|nr:hypothetical protein [Oligoflexia bacterium]
MKFLVLITTFFASTLAFAMPKVGDYVKFEGGALINGEKLSWTFEKELTSMDGEFFTLKETITPQSGKPTQTTSKMHVSSLMDDAKIDYIVTNCEKFGGNIMNAVFAIGNKQVCRISSITPDKAMAIYYLKIPFGHAGVAVQTKDNFSYLSLSDYRFGN